MKRILVSSTLIAALGGLLFGFDTAVISGTTQWLQSTYDLSSFELGFTVASALIGTIIGSLVIGRIADRYGRRSSLSLLALLYFISALGSGLAWSWYSLIFFRFVGGLGVGGASVVSPMYIAEVSPARLRGRLVAVAQLNIVFGMLLAYFSNYIISGLEIGASEWRWMFGVETIPAGLFFVFLFTIPRSPRWLVSKDKIDEAKLVLDKCGTDTGNIDDEIREIRQSLSQVKDTLKEPFFTKKYRTPIFLAIMIALFNQLSGINAVLYYAPHIFNMAGFDHVALSTFGKSGSLQFKDNQLVGTQDTIVSKLNSEDFDCSIIVGTDPISHLPFHLSKKLCSKPMIVIDNKSSATSQIADVILPTAITGIEVGGLSYRLDQVPIELKKILNPPSKIPSDEELLIQIMEKLNKE